MKKVLSATILSSALLLGACNADEEIASKENNESEIVSKQEAMTIKTLIKETTKAHQTLESFSASGTINMEMIMGEQQFNTNLSQVTRYTKEPLVVGIKQIIDNPMAGSGAEKIEMEMYLKDDHLFMFEPNSGKWFKQEIPDYKEMTNQMMSMDPEEQLKLISGQTDLFTITDSDENYEVVFDGKAEELEGAMSSLSQILGSQAPDLNSKNMTINSMNYKIHYNKETFFPVSMELTMDIVMDVEGERISMDMSGNFTYDEYNEIDSIELPSQAKDAQLISVE